MHSLTWQVYHSASSPPEPPNAHHSFPVIAQMPMDLHRAPRAKGSQMEHFWGFLTQNLVIQLEKICAKHWMK
jgi:hypothetical protein